MSIATPPPGPPAPPAPPTQNPTAQNPQPHDPGTPPVRESSRVVAIVVIVVGAVILLGAIGSSILGTWAAASVHTTSRAVEVTGVTELDVQVDAGDMRVEFADIDEAELEVRSAWGIDRWRLERDGGELAVASPDGWFNGWFGGWLGGNGNAVLRLPQSLEGMDADLGLAAGDLTVDGTFGELDLQVDAGRAEISGAADSVEARLSAGSAELELDDVGEAAVTVNAGSLEAAFSGRAPDELVAEVNAGSLRLVLPDGEYDVSSEVAAGSFDNRIGSVPGADNTIRVSVSAGEAVLRAQ
ncbi:hypothetical protein K0817_004460 [Microbacterium sp. HD4P20]|uniref:hypothetical protein n=1 Tax=Microbacterium sp. HD4P20 TaxID=2864874 RepID=UPI001C63D8D4|nr:hypothetical protein [Microbacterium sp. HD4P20]MCP2635819.1 hypothetical protein [Microbacterium sp. HD4P20]